MTLIDKAEAHDDDMIRRGDALECFMGYDRTGDIKDAIAALPAVTVGVQERVQHKKRGSTYRVLGRGKVQTDTPLADYAEVVVYQGEADGLVWVRPVTEFEDGRFAALEPVAAPDPAAIREAALREALDCCTDYGFTRADECRDAILALIQKGGDACDEDDDPTNARPATSPGVTAGAISKGAADDR